MHTMALPSLWHVRGRPGNALDNAGLPRCTHPDNNSASRLFVRMPFGLRNAAQTFQRFMDQVLRGLPFCFVYLDDLLVASPDMDTHLEHLRQVFNLLSDHGILIHPQKCAFAVSSLDFLGHRVSAAGITPLQSKVEAIQDYPQPTTTGQLRRFLGLVNFYHRFVPHCADILQPLHALLSAHPVRPKSAPLTWTTDAETALDAIKAALQNASLLSHPHPTAEVCLMTDASLTGVGGALQQRINGAWQPLSFFSRKLTPTQQRYSTLMVVSCLQFICLSSIFALFSRVVCFMSLLTIVLSSLSFRALQTATLPEQSAICSSSRSSPRTSGTCLVFPTMLQMPFHEQLSRPSLTTRPSPWPTLPPRKPTMPSCANFSSTVLPACSCPDSLV